MNLIFQIRPAMQSLIWYAQLMFIFDISKSPDENTVTVLQNMLKK